MLTITRFAVENLTSGCITDEAHPRFSFATHSDRAGAYLRSATISLGTWCADALSQTAIVYDGAPLAPFTTYTATLHVTDDAGEHAEESVRFETGRMGTAWDAMWISDGHYRFREKRVSPLPMLFQKTLYFAKPIAHARIFATAFGIYDLHIDGTRVGDTYFAPGFTSYAKQLPYQVYDVTGMLKNACRLEAVVSGGWAVGSFGFTRKNRISADRQALLLELRVRYTDGSEEIFGTDTTWRVTEQSAYRMADLYDGEIYDASLDPANIVWRNATREKPRHSPALIAAYGAPVRAHEAFTPIAQHETPEGTVYDFGQNFAGVVDLRLRAKHGQVVTVRHAEILNPDGTLNTAFLRTAKATITYICRAGEQTFSPTLTYMGFRYICISGIAPADITVRARALYSNVERIGDFACSNAMLTKLQENITWGARSNFVEIPTDCPQRDERMGWTGDIALFSPTACFNYDMSRFLRKWLRDLRAEQRPTGGIPNTVPRQGFGFPETMPTLAVDWWDDACILVPWAEYMARGDISILRDNYDTMKKYVDACAFWARLFSIGKHRYIWNTPAMLHFGDWVAPDVPKMQQWQARAKWTATASLCNTSAHLAKIASILGNGRDAAHYAALRERVAESYCDVFTDGNGKLHTPFQTGYVLPLYLDMFPDAQTKQRAADNLSALATQNGYRIATGFPGTPYILFALADNAHAESAYKMLLCTDCPSWLYEVKMGATTIWERWDGLSEDGTCPIGDDGTDTMISYNHYASGAVGDFLYRRVAGIEATAPAYRTFRVAPVLGGDLTWASAHVRSPYGEIATRWEIDGDRFRIDVTVPMGTLCTLELPNGEIRTYTSGAHSAECTL